MDHYGVVLRKLREMNQLSIKHASAKIGRSAGWLSEIENSKGEARILPQEFERIVGVYGGEPYRNKFALWFANQCKAEPSDREVSFSGAVLKYLRKKAKLTLAEVSASVSLSTCYLSYLENGVRPIHPELRDRLMSTYGYSAASFRNFATDDKRAKNIPVRYKLEILLGVLGEVEIERLFIGAVEASEKSKLQTKETER